MLMYGDDHGNTPLMEAAGEFHWTSAIAMTVALLIEAGAKVNVQNKEGQTALLKAARYGNQGAS